MTAVPSAPRPPTAAARRSNAHSGSARDADWRFPTEIGAARLAPVTMVSASFPTFSSIQDPSPGTELPEGDCANEARSRSFVLIPARCSLKRRSEDSVTVKSYLPSILSSSEQAA